MNSKQKCFTTQFFFPQLKFQQLFYCSLPFSFSPAELGCACPVLSSINSQNYLFFIFAESFMINLPPSSVFPWLYPHHFATLVSWHIDRRLAWELELFQPIWRMKWIRIYLKLLPWIKSKPTLGLQAWEPLGLQAWGHPGLKATRLQGVQVLGPPGLQASMPEGL